MLDAGEENNLSGAASRGTYTGSMESDLVKGGAVSKDELKTSGLRKKIMWDGEYV